MLEGFSYFQIIFQKPPVSKTFIIIHPLFSNTQFSSSHLKTLLCKDKKINIVAQTFTDYCTVNPAYTHNTIQLEFIYSTCHYKLFLPDKNINKNTFKEYGNKFFSILVHFTKINKQLLYTSVELISTLHTKTRMHAFSIYEEATLCAG